MKLPSLAAWTRRRREIAAVYRQAWADTPRRAAAAGSRRASGISSCVRVPDGRRDALAAHLAARGIDTAVYYPTPLHLQPALAPPGRAAGTAARAPRRPAREVLAVPVHAELTTEEVGRVCDGVRAFFAAGTGR